MKPSPLQLNRFFVTNLMVSANPKFNPKEKMNLGMEDITVETETRPPVEGSNIWQVKTSVFFMGSEKINSPYAFRVDLQGLFTVIDNSSVEKAQLLVETNGPSVLFSTAREILRSAMSSGPYKALILPTVSFYEPK